MHAAWLDLYSHLLRVRHRSIVPLLSRFPVEAGTCNVRGPRTLQVEWKTRAGKLRLDANLSEDLSAQLTPLQGEEIWLEGSLPAPDTLGPWSVRWSSLPL